MGVHFYPHDAEPHNRLLSHAPEIGPHLSSNETGSSDPIYYFLRSRTTKGAFLKKYFLTGLALLLPLALTLMILIFLINFFTAPFVHLVENHIVGTDRLSPEMTLFISRILSLILLALCILLLGSVTRWFFIKHLLAATNLLLSRTPLIKTVYTISRDIVAALFSLDGKKAFKYPLMIPFPHPSLYTIGFQAGEVAQEIQEALKAPFVSVFTPTAPHPITGFLLFIPEKDARKIDMSNEEAVKFIVSCGLICPERASEKSK